MNKLFAGSLAFGLVALSIACTVNNDGSDTPSTTSPSSSSTSPSPSASASSSSPTPDSGTTPTGSLLTCSVPAPTGSIVMPQLLPAQAAPLPAGGAFADGTYQLTAVKAYGSAASGTLTNLYGSLRAKETLEVANGQWRIAYHYEGITTTIDGAHAGTHTAAGAMLGGEETCDSGDRSDGIGGFLRPFTANGNSLDIFEDGAKEIIFTYTRQ